MPPHCDAIDSLVVQAAQKALDTVNVFHVLPWVPSNAEEEVRGAFEDVMHAREKHPDAQKVSDRWFFETVVRLHQLGEGMPYTGLKDAGDVGSVLPLAEKAIETGDLTELMGVLQEKGEFGLERYFDRVQATAGFDLRDTQAARSHVQTIIDFLHLADSIHKIRSGVAKEDRQTAIRKAEEEAKALLSLPFRRKRPAKTSSKS